MIDVSNAIVSGVAAGSIVGIVLALGRMLGLRANSELMLGTLFVGSSAGIAWIVGALISATTFCFMGLAYATGFEYLVGGAGPARGAVLSVLHTSVSGLALAAMPTIHPSMRMSMALEPGIFKLNYGPLDAVAFVVLHIAFGLLFGAFYCPLAESALR